MVKAKILFIDDDLFLRKVYQTELTERGFEVYVAVNGEDGLARTTAVHPDLIILDLIMPKKNGFEVLAELSRYKETRDIPVIVLSNLAQSDDQKRALDLGAVDYLVKGNTTLDVITQKIEYHLIESKKKGKKTGPETPSIAVAIPSEKLATVKQAASQPVSQSPIEDKTDRGHKFCPNCGFKIASGMKFCTDCGQQL